MRGLMRTSYAASYAEFQARLMQRVMRSLMLSLVPQPPGKQCSKYYVVFLHMRRRWPRSRGSRQVCLRPRSGGEAHVEGQVQKKTKAPVAALAAGLAGRRARVSHCPK